MNNFKSITLSHKAKTYCPQDYDDVRLLISSLCGLSRFDKDLSLSLVTIEISVTIDDVPFTYHFVFNPQSRIDVVMDEFELWYKFVNNECI